MPESAAPAEPLLVVDVGQGSSSLRASVSLYVQLGMLIVPHLEVFCEGQVEQSHTEPGTWQALCGLQLCSVLSQAPCLRLLDKGRPNLSVHHLEFAAQDSWAWRHFLTLVSVLATTAARLRVNSVGRRGGWGLPEGETQWAGTGRGCLCCWLQPRSPPSSPLLLGPICASQLPG